MGSKWSICFISCYISKYFHQRRVKNHLWCTCSYDGTLTIHKILRLQYSNSCLNCLDGIDCCINYLWKCTNFMEITHCGNEIKFQSQNNCISELSLRINLNHQVSKTIIHSQFVLQIEFCSSFWSDFCEPKQ